MEKNVQLISFVISAVIAIAILCFIPLRTKKILQKVGECVFSTKGRKLFPSVIVIVLSFALMVVLYFRNIGTFFSIVIYGVAILAITMSSSEISLSKYNGIYKNGIIGNGHFLLFSEIYAIPVLGFSKEEQENLLSNSIKFITTKKGNVSFMFADYQEQKEALKTILKLNPSLDRN